MSVLSKEDLAFWEENGYVVVREAVPQENLDAMVDVIWAFLEIDREDREQWYKYKPYTREDRCSPISAAGMVEIYQHQALWDNRQYPKVHQAFAEIWGEEKLWVSVDRANMKPPARADRPEWCNEGMIHWDADTSKQPVPFGVQGVLYLTDTAEDQGGFSMSPAREDEEARAQRIKGWQERRPAPNWPGDTRDWEHAHQQPAELTELGRKLLGVESWN